jgi:hypothetical protein
MRSGSIGEGGRAMSTRGVNGRREAIATLAALAALSLGAPSVNADQAPRLHVFMPTLMRPRALQAVLEPALPGVEVTIFGRVADFRAAVERAGPEAALAPAATLRAVGAIPVLLGVTAGNQLEPQLLLSKRPLAARGLAEKTVGVVDVVGRGRLDQLVARLLGLDRPPPIRRVVKVSDLLPLLQLDLADGILLPEHFLEEFRQMSELDFKILRLESALLERVAVAFPRPEGERRLGVDLRRLPGVVMAALGAEAWR